MMLKLSRWPSIEFDRREIALVMVNLPADTRRADASFLARAVLQELASRLRPGDFFEIIESAHGPRLAGHGRDVHVSLSYAGDKALIGLSFDRALGVDIVAVENYPEIDSLAGLYLPASFCTRKGYLRNENFALGWAKMEACCKALKLPLAEIDKNREKVYSDCRIVDCEQIDGYRIAAATAPPNSGQEKSRLINGLNSYFGAKGETRTKEYSLIRIDYVVILS